MATYHFTINGVEVQLPSILGTGFGNGTFFLEKQPTTLTSNGSGLWNNKYYINAQETTLDVGGQGSWNNDFYILGLKTTLDSKGNGYWNGEYYEKAVVKNKTSKIKDGNAFAKVVPSQGVWEFATLGPYKGVIDHYALSQKGIIRSLSLESVNIKLNGVYYYESDDSFYFFKNGQISRPTIIEGTKHTRISDGKLTSADSFEPLELQNYYHYFMKKGKISSFSYNEKISNNYFIFAHNNCNLWSSVGYTDSLTNTDYAGGNFVTGNLIDLLSLKNISIFPKLFFDTLELGNRLNFADGYFRIDENKYAAFTEGFKIEYCKKDLFEYLYNKVGFDRVTDLNIFSLRTPSNSFSKDKKIFCFNAEPKLSSVKTSGEGQEEGYKLINGDVVDGVYIGLSVSRSEDSKKVIVPELVLNKNLKRLNGGFTQNDQNLTHNSIEMSRRPFRTWKNLNNSNIERKNELFDSREMEFIRKNISENVAEEDNSTSKSTARLFDPISPLEDIEFAYFLSKARPSFLTKTLDNVQIDEYRRRYFSVYAEFGLYSVFDNIFYVKNTKEGEFRNERGQVLKEVFNFYKGYEKTGSEYSSYYPDASIKDFEFCAIPALNQKLNTRMGSSPFLFFRIKAKDGKKYFDSFSNGAAKNGLFFNGHKGMMPWANGKEWGSDVRYWKNFIKSENIFLDYENIIRTANLISSYDSEAYQVYINNVKYNKFKYDKNIPFDKNDVYFFKHKDAQLEKKLSEALGGSYDHLDILPFGEGFGIYNPADIHYVYNIFTGQGLEDHDKNWKYFNSDSGIENFNFYSKIANGPYSMGLFKDGIRVNRQTFFNNYNNVDNQLPMLTINSFSYWGKGYQRWWICYNDDGIPEGFKIDLTPLENGDLKRITRLTLSSGDYPNGCFETGVNANTNSVNSGNIKRITEISKARTAQETSAIIDNLNNPTKTSNSIDQIHNNSISVATANGSPSKTELESTKNGSNQPSSASIQTNIFAAKTGKKLLLDKDGKVKTAVTLNGVYVNGFYTIDGNFHRVPQKINSVDVEQKKDPSAYAVQMASMGKYISYENDGWVFANGSYLGKMFILAGENGYGGYFINGVRSYDNDTTGDDPYPETENGKYYGIYDGYAVVANGKMITSNGGPIWKNGAVASIPEGEKIKFEAREDDPKTIMVTTSTFEGIFGYDYTTKKSFYINEDGAVEYPIYNNFPDDPENTIYRALYSDSTWVLDAGVEGKTIGQYVTVFYMEDGEYKQTTRMENVTFEPGSQPPGSEPIVDTVPRKEGGSWIVYGRNDYTDISNLIKTELLDDNGNGFIKDKAPVQSVISYYDQGKRKLITEFKDAKFIAHTNGFGDDLDKTKYGVYYIQGHPTTYSKDKLAILRQAAIRMNADRKTMPITYMGENGNGLMSLKQLKNLNYDFSKDGSVDFIFDWALTRYPNSAYTNIGDAAFYSRISLGERVEKGTSEVLKAYTYIDIEPKKQSQRVSMQDLIDGIDNIKIDVQVRDLRTFSVPKLEDLNKLTKIEYSMTLREVISILTKAFPDSDPDDFILIEFKDGKSVGIQNLYGVYKKFQSYLNEINYSNWSLPGEQPPSTDFDDKNNFKPKTLPRKQFKQTSSIKGTIFKKELENVNIQNLIDTDDVNGIIAKDYPYYYINSLTTDEIFCPHGLRIYIEAAYPDSLDQDGNGTVGGIYFYSHMPTPLDENGDGFWFNTEFKGGKIV
jgi:hypothetical protein